MHKCFFSSILNIGNVFRDIMHELGLAAYTDRNNPSVHNRMVYCYHKHMSDEDKNFILKEFLKSDSFIRLVIASSAFGSGVDIPDIKNIVCFDNGKTGTELWQAIGRGGRDGNAAHAQVFFTNRVLVRCDSAMQELLKGVRDGTLTCFRREILLSFALPKLPADQLKLECSDKTTCCCICRRRSCKD
jgi:superfamily II DNA/RNA helicase